MNGLKRGAIGLLGTLLVVAAGASMWFWFTPVGVNNYVNKVTLQLAIDSPELLTYLGAIDNTPLDFHSGKLADYTKEEEERSIAKLRNAREGLDDYGPDGLSGQELLTWKIAAWFFDDQLRQAELRYSGYRVNQISGVTVNMPQFLTDTHVIKNKKSKFSSKKMSPLQKKNRQEIKQELLRNPLHQADMKRRKSSKRLSKVSQIPPAIETFAFERFETVYHDHLIS